MDFWEFRKGQLGFFFVYILIGFSTSGQGFQKVGGGPGHKH